MTVDPLIDALAEFAGAVSDAIGKDYNLDNSRAEAHLREYASERVAMINRTTREALHRALDEEDPVAAVRHVFDVARSSRAKQIAVSEVVRTSNWAAIDAGKWQGQLDLKRWATQQDARVRSEHVAMHNQTVGWNESFTAPGGRKAKYPGGFGVAALDVGCRCAALPARRKQQAELDDYGDAVTLYEDLRAPFVDRLEAAWREVFDEQERAALALLE